jgi:hypothetical protein
LLKTEELSVVKNFRLVGRRGFKIENIMDYTETEQDGIFLEAGSLLWIEQMKRLIVLFHLGLTSYLLSFVKILILPQWCLKHFKQ